jgi:hypothetical protein
MDDACTLDHLRRSTERHHIQQSHLQGRLVVETGEAQSERTTTRVVHEEQLAAMKAAAVAVLRLIADAGPV